MSASGTRIRDRLDRDRRGAARSQDRVPRPALPVHLDDRAVGHTRRSQRSSGEHRPERGRGQRVAGAAAASCEGSALGHLEPYVVRRTASDASRSHHDRPRAGPAHPFSALGGGDRSNIPERTGNDRQAVRVLLAGARSRWRIGAVLQPCCCPRGAPPRRWPPPRARERTGRAGASRPPPSRSSP